jgi:4-oxalocrotonate tautomerase
MPYVNIKVTREGVTHEQKAALIAGVTELLERVLHKDPATTHVVIDEIDPHNWGLAGMPVPAYREKQRERQRS